MANIVIETGRLTHDPELATTSSGKEYCRFRIAVPRAYIEKGEKERKSDFFDVVVWGERAKFVCTYFTKGKWIEVIGSLQSRTWEKDGVKRFATEIVADKVMFVGNKEKSNTEHQGTDDFSDMPEDDDLPF